MKVYGKVAGIDVHKQVPAVVVADRNDPEHTCVERRFGTTTKSLRELREWLTELQVEEVAMGIDGAILEDGMAGTGRPLPAVLGASALDGGSERAEIGFCDALRIVNRLLSQDLTLSYVPDAEQRRRRRILACTRTQLIEDRVRIQSRIECLLEEGRIKLSSVVSDLLGATSRIILRALARGWTTSPPWQGGAIRASQGRAVSGSSQRATAEHAPGTAGDASGPD